MNLDEFKASGLQVRKAPKRRTIVKPEQALQIAIVRYWRPRLERVGGWLYGLNGERTGGKSGSGITAATIAKAMGYCAGQPDMMAELPAAMRRGLWPYGWLEVKTDDGRLQANQAAFRDRCVAAGVPWACVRSIEDVGRAFEAWGWRI